MHSLWVWIKRIILLCWFLVLVFFGAWIVSDNPSEITLTLMGIVSPKSSLGVYICVAVFFGVILGFITSYLVTQGRLFSKNRELSRARKEVQQLRASHL